MLSTDPREKVGAPFDEKLLLKAQALGWEAINRTAAQLKPGMSEEDAKEILNGHLTELGAEKSWHPTWVRFGPNTRLPYGKPSDKSVRLRENDVFFFDIGPVFLGHESDVGKTYVVGNDSDLKRLASDAEKVFKIVRGHFLETKINGPELYEFAKKQATQLGWELSLEGASGHRISDFPHSVHHRGALDKFERAPTKNLWILEIHLHDVERNVGAFYEDLL